MFFLVTSIGLSHLFTNIFGFLVIRSWLLFRYDCVSTANRGRSGRMHGFLPYGASRDMFADNSLSDYKSKLI